MSINDFAFVQRSSRKHEKKTHPKDDWTDTHKKRKAHLTFANKAKGVLRSSMPDDEDVEGWE